MSDDTAPKTVTIDVSDSTIGEVVAKVAELQADGFTVLLHPAMMAISLYATGADTTGETGR